MASDYLSKYYSENNPVITRLTIVKKILIRVICFIVSTVVFLILRLLNSHNIFHDISPILLWFIYIVMALCSLISLVGLVFLLLMLINKEKANSIINAIPFNVKKKIFMTLDWLLVLPICICVALFAYGNLFRIQMVSGDSMKPTFLDGERVIITYTDNLKRGDVVICNINQESFVVAEDSYWIKRIIGLPGDSLTWNEYGLTLNGKPVDEEYIFRNENGTLSIGDYFDGEFIYKKTDDSYGIKIPDGYVFVMGDNRGVSQDSRVIGLVPIENVLGIVRAHMNGLKFEGFVGRGALE